MNMIRQARIHPRLRTLPSHPARFSVIAALILFGLPISPAVTQKSITSSISLKGGVVKLPVIDKQDIRFTRVFVNGESLQSRIQRIVQDDYGFLWLGTTDGLYKYDGYRIQPYRHESGNPNSPADDTVMALYKDRDGSLWIGSRFGGVDRLDPSRGTFTHYRHEPGNPGSLASDIVSCIYRDRSGVLWIGTGDGLDRLESSGTFVHYRHNPQDAGSLSSNYVISLYEDRHRNFWVGTDGGLNKLDRTTRRFARFLYDPTNPRSIGHNYVSSILEDRSGILWVASAFGSGLSALDVKTGEFTRYSFHAEEPSSQSVEGVTGLSEDRLGRLWVCTIDRGLLRFDRKRNAFIRYANEPGNPNSLPNDTVYTVFEDAGGLMWVGTQTGFSRFQQGPPSFVDYQHRAANPNSLHNNMIWSVQGDSLGFLWMGGEDGFNRLDPRTGQFTFYYHDVKDPHSPSYDKIAAIREDPSGTLWFGTYGGGLDRFDRATGQFFAYRHDPKNPASLSSDAVLSLLIDRQGTLWVGTQGGGLDHLDTRTGRFTSYLNEPPDSDFSLVVLFEDRAGMLWAGTPDRGLIRFDPRTKQVKTYRHNSEDPHSLSNNKVTAIREDWEGRLWIGTKNGLDLLDRSRGTATIFTTRDGLPDNAVESILEDHRGYLWLGTHNGLSRLDPQTRNFRNYYESDGLAGNLLDPYGPEGSCRTPDGEMVFGSTNGVTEFNPDRVSDNGYVPPVELTDFLLFNTPVKPGKNSPLHKPIWATDLLTLNHDQSIFTFEFAALSYLGPERNRYRYRLEGLENKWNEVDSSRRLATYTSLPAGNYVFRVQGSNNDGVWNEKGARLRIAILPPWWATWWFRSIMSLTIATLIFGAYRSRVSQLKLRFEERLAERTHIAQELHDTLIQEVVAVGLQLDLIDDQISNEPGAAKPTFDLVRQRVRQLIDHGRRTLWDLRSSTASTNDLIESLSRAGTELSSGELPHFRLFVQGDRRPLHSLIRDELDRIGREAITNAFRHAHAKAIEVGLFYFDHAIRLVVRDDGGGIAPDTILKGRPGHFGLTGMRERAERVGGRLTVRSRIGGGTEVNLFVPLHRGAQFPRTASSPWFGRWIRWTGPRKNEFNGSEAGSDYEHAGKDSHTQC